MNQIELVKKIEGMFPGAKNSGDGSGYYRNVPLESEVRKVAVCIEIGECDLGRFRDLGIDFVVAHHEYFRAAPSHSQFGPTVFYGIQNNSVKGGYVLNDMLHRLPGGIVDSVAKLFDFDAVEGIPLTQVHHYQLSFIPKLQTVENSALIGLFDEPMNLGYFIDSLPGSEHLASYSVSTAQRPISRVLITSGHEIRKGMLAEAMDSKPDLIIAGGLEDRALRFARDNKVQLLCLGTYNMHDIAMAEVARQLANELAPHGAEVQYLG